MPFASIRIVTDDLDALVAFYEWVTGRSAERPAPVFAQFRGSGVNLAIASSATVAMLGDAVIPATNRSVLIEFEVADVDAEFAEEFLVDVRVPRENLLGDLNDGWKVANRLLGSERFTTGHPRNAAVLLNKARQIAELTGATRETGFLHKLAVLEIDLMAFSAYYRHAAALHGEKRAPFSMAPVIKIVGGELGRLGPARHQLGLPLRHRRPVLELAGTRGRVAPQLA